MKWMATIFASFRAMMIATLAGQAGGAAAQQDNPADENAWQAAMTTGTAEACQTYLNEFPTGAHAEAAFRCLVEGAMPGAGEAQSGQPVGVVDIY